MGTKNYDELSEITVHSQSEMNDVPKDFTGRIFIEGNARVSIIHAYYLRVDARGNSSVVARGNSSVVARGNSSVVAQGNSSVEARDNSSVVAWDNSSVDARGNSSVDARGNSSVVARGNSSVVARGNSSVVAQGNSSVDAWGNSSVVARDNSSVVAWDNSSVDARGNSSVDARGNSSVVARGNSSVEARGNSSVEAWDNSSVEAWDNSSVEARGNSQIVNRQISGKIKLHGNAREVFMPKTVQEFMDFYGIKHTKKKAILYKAVRKNDDGILHANYDESFTYTVGKVAKEPNINRDTEEACGTGIHVAYLNWALDFGKDWDNFAIVEVEVDIDDIVMPFDATGKVRVSQCKVLREVPLEECGVYGRVLAKKHKR